MNVLSDGIPDLVILMGSKDLGVWTPALTNSPGCSTNQRFHILQHFLFFSLRFISGLCVNCLSVFTAHYMVSVLHSGCCCDKTDIGILIVCVPDYATISYSTSQAMLLSVRFK